MAATMGSETTAAAAGQVGRRAPRPVRDAAVLRLQHGDYFQHWLDLGKKARRAQAAEDLLVNWFRKDEDGKFLWPGFGENMRVLKWIVERWVRRQCLGPCR
jgi:phosphoenolpyruvate carboxykinase (GTP)